jgi:hypothetical protein
MGTATYTSVDPAATRPVLAVSHIDGVAAVTANKLGTHMAPGWVYQPSCSCAVQQKTALERQHSNPPNNLHHRSQHSTPTVPAGTQVGQDCITCLITAHLRMITHAVIL